MYPELPDQPPQQPSAPVVPSYQVPSYQVPPMVPGYPAPVVRPLQPTNGLAIASMIVGIVAIALLPCALAGSAVQSSLAIVPMLVAVAPALVAVEIGHRSLRLAAQRGGVGRPFAITGLATGYTATALSVALAAVRYLGGFGDLLAT